jgi:hypothetical protein
MTGTILLQPPRDSSVFYISNHGTKHHVANYDTFLKLGFDHVQLRKGIPWDVINAFDTGDVIDDAKKPLPRKLSQEDEEEMHLKKKQKGRKLRQRKGE